MIACIIDNKIDEDALVYVTEAGLEQLIPVVGNRMKFLHFLKSKRSASEKQYDASQVLLMTRNTRKAKPNAKT